MKKLVFILFIGLVFIYCKNTPSTTQQNIILKPSGQSGKELSQTYCGSCHLYPEPALLDKKSWTKELLPNMGARLGIKTPNYDPFKKITGLSKMMVQTENIYPTTPLIAQEDWDKIVQFYQQEAPDSISRLPKRTGIATLKNFKIRQPPSNIPPLTTLTAINDLGKTIHIGLLDGSLLTFDKQLNLKNTVLVPTTPVALSFQQNSSLKILAVGQIHPNELQEGEVFETNPTGVNKVFGNLRRPVHFTPLGTDEWLICEYGYQKGRLSFYRKQNNSWKGKELTATAGATKALAHDFNKDGLLDAAVLMAQGDEHISIFYNTDKDGFTEKQVLRFPPVYGSSDLQLVDFNKDGFMDLLYTNGDNEDFSPILKPYHGVRLYLNDGKDNFTEGAFFPMHGAFQAKAADFDLDGDLDIVVTSFFPDDKTKPESHFLYLEQVQNLEFKATTFKEATQGKWMTLDVNDVDGDGDVDILLGSFVIPLSGAPPVVDKKQKILPFLFLENTIKNPVTPSVAR